MTDALTLALLGAVEAVVYLLRYRSAHSKSWAWSAFTTMLITSTRVASIMLGATVAINGESPVLAACAYVVSATLVTGAFHAWLERGASL